MSKTTDLIIIDTPHGDRVHLEIPKGNDTARTTYETKIRSLINEMEDELAEIRDANTRQNTLGVALKRAGRGLEQDMSLGPCYFYYAVYTSPVKPIKGIKKKTPRDDAVLARIAALEEQVKKLEKDKTDKK